MALKTSYTHLSSGLARVSKLIGLSGFWRCGFERCLHNGFSSANGTQVNEMCSPVYTTRFVDNQTVDGAENIS